MKLLSALVVVLALAGGTVPSAPAYAQVASVDTVRFFRAVPLDDAATVRRQLAAGMDPNAINPVGGEPAMVLALRNSAMNVFGVLLVQPTINLETPAINGNTALMMAAYQHNAAAVTALLARGAAVTQPGWTALHYAAAAGDDGITRQLLDHGAAIDAVSPPASGKFTPLMMAAREGHDRTVRLLLGAGANTAVRNAEGLDAAGVAERADKADIAAAIRAHVR
jgi:ankyrin repeat protein